MGILIKNGNIFTQNAKRSILLGADVFITGGKISAIGKLDCKADLVIDASGRFVLPGFINAHVHLGETIFKPFISGGISLQKYLETTDKLTTVSKWVEIDRGIIARYYATKLLAAGTTAIAGGRTSPYAEKVGLRSLSGYMLMCSPKLEQFLPNFEKNIKAAASTGRSAVFLHSLNRTNRDILRRLSIFMQKSPDTILMMHAGETVDSAEQVRRVWGLDELGILEANNLLNERTILVHGACFTTMDFQKIARKGASIVHCLNSNLNLSGTTLDLPAALKAGVRVLMGTDGIVTGSTFSILKEAVDAFHYHNAVRGVISPSSFLDMLTLNAAAALGFNDLGSIEVNKTADIIILEPLHSNREFSAEALIENVDSLRVHAVFVGGKLVFGNQNTKNPAEDEFAEVVRKVAADINAQRIISERKNFS